MSSIAKLKFLVADRLFYESLDNYSPDLQVFGEPVKRLLPSDWTMVRKGIWFHVHPPDKTLALQGWKIHLSATEQSGRQLLIHVVPLLVAQGVAFKFAVDQRMLSLMTSKGWNRASSGKFITIYPGNDAQFRDLIDELYRATNDFRGPAILSDRPYRDSSVIYYRYGGITPTAVITATGERKLVISAPDGQKIPDERQAHFVLPPWVEDPFSGNQESSSSRPAGALKDGRYIIRSTLASSNSGAVYLVNDNHTAAMAVVKEARPLLNMSADGIDAVGLLRKEFRLLQTLEHTGIAPRALEIFEEAGRVYLVEEYLSDTVTLRSYAGPKLVVLLTRPTRQKIAELWSEYRRIFIQVAELIKIAHQAGIILMDLSPNNILLKNDGQNILTIDLESAVQMGQDTSAGLVTPGFASIQDMEASPHFEMDYYALGALMLHCIIPINSMMDIDPHAPHRFLESVITEYGLPPALCSLITQLLDPKPSVRPTPLNVIDTLNRLEMDASPEYDVTTDLLPGYRSVLLRVSEYVLSTATYDRDDRLFPADPKMFVTGPLNVAYGASGVAYALKRITGDVPDRVSDWILRQPVNEKLYPPGLYFGIAGIAWVLEELGFDKRAEELMHSTWKHPGLFESADIFYGLAGWGIAQLKFFIKTGDDEYLRQATLAGQKLMTMARKEKDYLFWPHSNRIVLGFAHGASGISIFLLYLYILTRNEQFLEAGKKALDFDLNASSLNPEGNLSWQVFQAVDAPGIPYLRYGTSGVGKAVARYHQILNNPHYRELLDRMIPDTNRKYAISPGRFVGLAGIGDFLLDIRESVETRFVSENLQKILDGIMLFKVETEKGIAFPGYELYRLSCDYGTGSAGIGLFLHRYLTGCNSDFLLDDLLFGTKKVNCTSGSGSQIVGSRAANE